MPQDNQPPRRTPPPRNPTPQRKKPPSFFATHQSIIYIVLLGVLCVAIGFMAIFLVLRSRSDKTVSASITPVPTLEVSITPEPTLVPTPEPTLEPTLEPTPTIDWSTPEPTLEPTDTPTPTKTPKPATKKPTATAKPATAAPVTPVPVVVTATPAPVVTAPPSSSASVSVGGSIKQYNGETVIHFSLTPTGRTTVYIGISESPVAPTSAELKAKHEGMYQNISTNIEGNIAITPGKTYYLWAMTETNGVLSAVTGSGAIGSGTSTTPTATPVPTATGGDATVNSISAKKTGTNEIDVTVKTSKEGRLYVMLAYDTTSRSAQQVKDSGNVYTIGSSLQTTVSATSSNSLGTIYIWTVLEANGVLGAAKSQTFDMSSATAAPVPNVSGVSAARDGSEVVVSGTLSVKGNAYIIVSAVSLSSSQIMSMINEPGYLWVTDSTTFSKRRPAASSSGTNYIYVVPASSDGTPGTSYEYTTVN